MYVSKAYRNQGVGMNLMDSAISRIKENNEIRKIKLTVTADQQFAMMLYKQCGFENTGVFKNELHFGGKYYDEYLMEKYI
jgi:ribosomal protein S18 acetylase RimI-like enzyme